MAWLVMFTATQEKALEEELVQMPTRFAFWVLGGISSRNGWCLLDPGIKSMHCCFVVADHEPPEDIYIYSHEKA